MNSEPFYPVSLCLRLPPPSARDGCHASDRALLRSLGSPQTPLCGFPSVASGPFQSSSQPSLPASALTAPHPIPSCLGGLFPELVAGQPPFPAPQQ